MRPRSYSAASRCTMCASTNDVMRLRSGVESAIASSATAAMKPRDWKMSPALVSV